MKENVGSLRAYFLLAGVVGGYANIVGGGPQAGAATLLIPLGSTGGLLSIAGILYAVVGVGLAGLFIFLGLRLPALVAAHSSLPSKLILVAGSLLLLKIVVDLILGLFISAAIGGVSLLVVWYLLSNVRRLASESSMAGA